MGCARLSGPRSCRCMRGCGACSRTCGGAWTCGRGGCASRPCGGAARSFGRGPGPPGFWSDAARCWCCASRNRCGDRLAGRRRDSVRHRAGSRRGRAVLHEGARRAALVVLEELPAIGAGRAREVTLRGGGRDVGFVARGGLARVGHAPDAVRTAVVADAAVVDVVDHYVVRIHVGDMRDVHIGHRAVVEVAVVVPVAAHETDADITEAVVDAAVEADVRPPVAGVPQIDAVHETPVARRPQRAGIRRPAPRRPAPRSSRCGSGSSSRAPRYSRRRAAAAGCRRAGAAAGWDCGPPAPGWRWRGPTRHRRGGRRRIGLRRPRPWRTGRPRPGPQEGKADRACHDRLRGERGRGSIAVTIIVVRPGVGGVIVVIRRRPVVGRPRRHHHASAQHAGQGKHQHQALFMEGRVSVGARRSPSAGRQACPICAVCGVWGFPCSWLLRASGARAAPVLRSQELGHLPEGCSAL